MPRRTGCKAAFSSYGTYVSYVPFPRSCYYGALSAIDIALWDIAGKYHGVPVYQLLVGKCRDKARVYYHVFGENIEELVEGCKQAKKDGFTAIGHLTPSWM
ncbi:MAG: hypothetical protein ACLTER_26695 [Ruminococcus sp.]